MFEVALSVSISALLGIALWTNGYRLFITLLPVFGFLAGFWLTATILAYVIGEGILRNVFAIFAALIVGLAVAAIAYVVYLIGVTIVSAVFGLYLGSGILLGLGVQPGLLAAVVAVAIGAALAWTALNADAQRYLVVLMTAIAGANLMVLAGLVVTSRVAPVSVGEAGSIVIPMLQDTPLWLILWLFLAIVGVTVQLRTTVNYSPALGGTNR